MALVRAVPLLSFLDTARSTSHAGTAYSTELPTSAQALYAGWHLTSALATSTSRVIVVTVQSASSSGFGTLTTEISFSLTSGEGSSWARYASPSTDQPWRRANLVMTTAASTDNTWKGIVWAGFA